MSAAYNGAVQISLRNLSSLHQWTRCSTVKKAPTSVHHILAYQCSQNRQKWPGWRIGWLLIKANRTASGTHHPKAVLDWTEVSEAVTATTDWFVLC